jgi:prepilin-type processing-associated H-X9-DG protein
MICPLCETELKNKKNIAFFDCHVCFALVKNSSLHLSEEEERARYETHNNDVYDIRYQNFTSPITQYVLTHFKPHHMGLDFGSGTGPVISKVLQDNKYTIAQYDPFFAPHVELLSGTYDYIVSCEVIEHFYNPLKEFTLLYNMLRRGGALLLMTDIYTDVRDFNTWGYLNDPTHVFIYRPETLAYIARKFNLNIEQMTHRFICFRK